MAGFGVHKMILRQSVATLFGGLIASSLSACVLNWYLIVTNANTTPIKKLVYLSTRWTVTFF